MAKASFVNVTSGTIAVFGSAHACEACIGVESKVEVQRTSDNFLVDDFAARSAAAIFWKCAPLDSLFEGYIIS